MATDEKGRFIFTKLSPAENYSLTAVKFGFFDGRNRARVALADGQWFTDAKITLWRFGAISGVVTDETNEPVVGAFVRVLVQVMVAGTPQLSAGPVTRTDDRGVYRIAGLAPGRYIVSVPSVQWSVPADTDEYALQGLRREAVASMEAAGYSLPKREDRTTSPDGKNLLFLGHYVTPPPAGSRAMAYPPSFHPAARSPKDASVVELKNGEERNTVDLQLRPVPVVRVSGTIDAPPEAGVAGMTLRLLPAGAEGLGNGSEVATALVAQDGTFTFLSVPSGDYTIIANRQQMEFQTRNRTVSMDDALPNAPGALGGGAGGGGVPSASAGTTYSYRGSDGNRSYAGKLAIAVGARDLTDVVVPLKRLVTLTARLVYEFELPASPAPGRGGGLPVYAEPADGSAALGMPTGRTSPTEPTFLIEGLQPGQYTIRFVSLRAGRIKTITWDGKDYTNRPLDASTGRDITDVVVTVTDKTTRVNGYAREQNQMATHGSVIFFPAEPDQWTNYGFSPRRILSSPIGTNGAFSATTLPPGNYLAIAVDESLATAWQDPKFLAAAASLATRITVEWGDAKTVDLTVMQVPGFKGGGD